MMLDISAAVLVLQQPAPGGGGIANTFFIQILLIIAIFYVLVFRPQAKQRKSHENALKSLKRGDRIVTTGGIIGDVVHIKETTKDGAPAPSMDDEVTIKSAESRLIVERGRIAKILTSTAPVTT